jgi:hypothetical protein
VPYALDSLGVARRRQLATGSRPGWISQSLFLSLAQLVGRVSVILSVT